MNEDLIRAAQAAWHLCQSLLATREGATDDLIRGVAEALEAAIRRHDAELARDARAESIITL